MAIATAIIIATTPPTMYAIRSVVVAKPAGGAFVGAGVSTSLAVNAVESEDP